MKITAALFISILLFSCGKSSNTSQPPVQSNAGKISYKVNGQAVSIDSANFQNGEYVIFTKHLQGPAFVNTQYLMDASKDLNNVLHFAIVTDSLQVTSYNYDSTSVAASQAESTFALVYNGNESLLFFNGDNFNIDISSYTGGRISGTFTGKFTSGSSVSGTHGNILITEGKITNVQVKF